jgi:deoxyribose-phosphate aldolase
MNINEFIDHTNLSMDASIKDIEKLCKEAKENHFTSVCISPYYVPFAKKLLEDSTVEICTVVGFPLGQNTKEVKVYEAIEAINEGATEIDLVINIGSLKDKDYEYIKDEIIEVRDSLNGRLLKVIVETALLTKEELIKVTEICNETFVHFIKTGTGFNNDDNLVESVKTIMKYKNEVIDVKASGGISTKEQIEELINLGVTRIGTSKILKIIKEEE